MYYNGLDYNNYNENELIKIYGNKLDKSYYKRNKVRQIKLLLNEIYFINNMKNKFKNIDNIIVCGGAPGTHYLLLSNMFPEINFILYDKTSFNSNLKYQKNIILNNDYISLNNISSIKYNNSLFISDLKTLEYENNKNSFNGDLININDMYNQLSIFQLSSCIACLLKFQIPKDFKMPYLNGYLLIQPFITSNELRIICYKHTNFNQFKIYDGSLINEKCQLINNYWKQNELNLTEDEKNFISKYKLKNNWDNISLYHILNDANKLEFTNKIIESINDNSYNY